MDFLAAVILAIVEGLTEYLPVSSTGHMIITSALLGIGSQDFVKIFTVNIQFGAILAVVVLYWRRFLQSFDFYFKLLVAFIPAAVLGLLLGDYIDALLENVWVVAVSLILGGIVLVFIDKYFARKAHTDISPDYGQAFKIGLFQCLALVPGVSRSAATIIGGMSQRLTRAGAAEFSFFLAVPTMLAASAYKLLKGYLKGTLHFTQEELQLLLLGNVVAFVVAMLAIRFFINFLTRYGFRAFGYYRIVVGLILLVLLLSGTDLHVL